MRNLESGTPASYSVLAKLFHWGFVALFAYGIIKQVTSVDQLEDMILLQFEMIFASGFLCLLILRFVYMKRTQTSALPPTTPLIQKHAARCVHAGLYTSLALIACSGLMIGFLFWFGFKGGVVMAAVIGVHEFSVLLAYTFIFVHVMAALYHRFKRDGVWTAMTPFWKE